MKISLFWFQFLPQKLHTAPLILYKHQDQGTRETLKVLRALQLVQTFIEIENEIAAQQYGFLGNSANYIESHQLFYLSSSGDSSIHKI